MDNILCQSNILSEGFVLSQEISPAAFMADSRMRNG